MIKAASTPKHVFQCLHATRSRLMVFKLVMAASRTWRRLQGQNQLPKVINGVEFKDGIEVVAEIKSAA